MRGNVSAMQYCTCLVCEQELSPLGHVLITIAPSCGLRLDIVMRRLHIYLITMPHISQMGGGLVNRPELHQHSQDFVLSDPSLFSMDWTMYLPP